MASKSKKVKTMDKWRKKRYFSVLAPKIFQERNLGKSIAYEPDLLINRTLTTNLMVLTGNIKKQNINVTFKIDKVRGDTAYTTFDRYALLPSAIKRKIRRQRNRLDESFKCVTKDGKLVRIKPLVVTAIKVSKNVQTDLRKAFIDLISSVVSSKNLDSLVLDFVNETLQREIRSKLSHISPIRSVDIRILKCLGDADAANIKRIKHQELKRKAASKSAKAEADVEEDASAEDASDAGDAETVDPANDNPTKDDSSEDGSAKSNDEPVSEAKEK